MAGHDPKAPTSLSDPAPDLLAGLRSGIRGARIGIDGWFAADGTDPGLVQAIEQALETLTQLGAVVELQKPEETAQIADPRFAVCAAEACQAHAKHFPSWAAEYGP